MTVVALFRNVTWKPVTHTVVRSAEQICEEGKE